MSDRVQLEMAEARELLFNYHLRAKVDKLDAAAWLSKRINAVGKLYGYGFDARVRKYMRQIDDGDGNV